MPGVIVTTETRTGPIGAGPQISDQWFVSGLAERGPVDQPIRLRGMADYRRLMGGRVTYGALYDALQTFFEEGGNQAYVARVVGPAATVGNLTLMDRAVTPVATLRVDAANPGAWSGQVTAEVRDGATANTFRLTIRLNGEVVHDENNLTSPADAVRRFDGSPYVRLVDLGSATAPPANNPAVRAATALSAGSDDRAAVTAAMQVDALARFSAGLGDGAVSIPGQGNAVHAGVNAHATANNRVAILASARAASQATLTSQAAAINSDAAGLFAPWVLIPDGSGGTYAISPEGFVAGKRATMHRQVGPWRAPAGQAGMARFVVGVDESYDRRVGDELDAARVSVIRPITGTIRLYGYRSLSTDEQNYRLLTARDLLNRLEVEAERLLEQYVYEPIDGRGALLSSINAALTGMVDPIRAAGGLFELYDAEGNEVDPGYKVDTGPSVNSLASLSTDTVRAILSVRISPTAALINLTIVKVGVTAAL